MFKVLSNDGDGNGSYLVCNDAKGNYVQIVSFFFKRYWYCLYIVLDHPFDSTLVESNWVEVCVYRIPPAPKNYRSVSDLGRRINREGKTYSPDSQQRYLGDFYEIITGRDATIHIPNDLIYSDRIQSSGKPAR